MALRSDETYNGCAKLSKARMIVCQSAENRGKWESYMQPGFDLRIRSMLKALSETVLPAVDGGNRAAVEQLHLVIGSLELIRQQIDYAHWFEVIDARTMGAMIDRIVAEVGEEAGSKDAATAAKALATAERHDVTLTAVRDANSVLRDTVGALVAKAYATGDEVMRKRVQAIVLAHSKGQITRERAFIAATGFDVFPDTMVSIEESLTLASA